MKLLDKLEAINKELKLNESHERSATEKQSYVETQIDEIRAIMWRLRCDILLNSVIEVVGEAEAAEQESKVKAYKRDLKRMGEAVNVYSELLEELRG